ncbi:hypothetical protein [Streptomyces cinerochromogenes]|uniref:hypothetical protein n=1 Tax=Streptomyces cinerochromogenes TaxID=66422 RepID=UPI0019A84DE4|nr:hypothetical protein [Streptomyces cinerochromogenes]GGS53358.1 hypothetical protein GCM10010206_13690 [Streptomyces cinerochromogenes]
MTERRAIPRGSTFEERIGCARAVVDGDWVHVSGATGSDYATMTISDDVVRVRCLLPDRADCEPCRVRAARGLFVSGGGDRGGADPANVARPFPSAGA